MCIFGKIVIYPMRISSAYLVVRYVKVHFLKKSIPYISQVCTIMQIFTPGNTINRLVRGIFLHQCT